MEDAAAGAVHRLEWLAPGSLRQAVDLHRADGSIRRAYARRVALPPPGAARRRLLAEAGIVLDLALGAVAAAERARLARDALARDGVSQ